MTIWEHWFPIKMELAVFHNILDAANMFPNKVKPGNWHAVGGWGRDTLPQYLRLIQLGVNKQINVPKLSKQLWNRNLAAQLNFLKTLWESRMRQSILATDPCWALRLTPAALGNDSTQPCPFVNQGNKKDCAIIEWDETLHTSPHVKRRIILMQLAYFSGEKQISCCIEIVFWIWVGQKGGCLLLTTS